MSWIYFLFRLEPQLSVDTIKEQIRQLLVELDLVS